MKKIATICALVLALAASGKAESVTNKVIDSSSCFDRPTTRKDNNGIEHVVWFSQDHRIYKARSDSDFLVRETVSAGAPWISEVERSPEVAIDSLNRISVVATMARTQWSGFPSTPSLFWITEYFFKPTPTGSWSCVQFTSANTSNTASLAIGPNNNKYVVVASRPGVQTHFDLQYFVFPNLPSSSPTLTISRGGDQTEPRVAVDSNNVAHLIWYDTLVNGIMYAKASDGFTNKTTVGANSYDADLAIAKDGTPMVAYKQDDGPFTSIYIQPALNNGAAVAIATAVDTIKGRPVSLSIDAADTKYIAWSESSSPTNVALRQATIKGDIIKTTLLDETGTNPALGWVDSEAAVTYANIHSIVRYEILADPKPKPRGTIISIH